MRDDPVGKYLTVEEGGQNIQNLVTGVAEDPPSNSHFHFGILAALSTFDFSRQQLGIFPSTTGKNPSYL